MERVGLYVRLETKPERAEDVAAFLKQGVALANEEAGTVVWYAVRFGPTTFGIFDEFAGQEARQAHLDGPIAAALMAKKDELLAAPPSIEAYDILGAKLPS